MGKFTIEQVSTEKSLLKLLIGVQGLIVEVNGQPVALAPTTARAPYVETRQSITLTLELIFNPEETTLENIGRVDVTHNRQFKSFSSPLIFQGSTIGPVTTRFRLLERKSLHTDKVMCLLVLVTQARSKASEVNLP